MTDTETRPTSSTPLWTSVDGCVYRDGEARIVCYPSGNSFYPDPKLADIVAMRLNSYEEANPGALEAQTNGHLETRPARDDGKQQRWGEPRG